MRLCWGGRGSETQIAQNHRKGGRDSFSSVTAVLAAGGTSFIREMLMLGHTKLTGVSQSGEGVFFWKKRASGDKVFRTLGTGGCEGQMLIRKLTYGNTAGIC